MFFPRSSSGCSPSRCTVHGPAWAGSGLLSPSSNVGLFFAVRSPPLVPDVLLSMDVDLPADLHPKRHRSYFLWEYGKPPDVVIEVVSNREGGEDSQKLAAYARVAVPYYVIFDPDRLLSAEVLRGYRLDATEFHKMDEPLWFPDVGLGLRLWQGRYEEHDITWLRWVDAEGMPVPTGQERAEAERQRATGLPNNCGSLASNRPSRPRTEVLGIS